MHGSGGSQEAKTESWGHMHRCPSHPEGHFGSFSLLKRNAVVGDGNRAVVCSRMERKANPSLTAESEALQAMPPLQPLPS